MALLAARLIYGHTFSSSSSNITINNNNKTLNLYSKSTLPPKITFPLPPSPFPNQLFTSSIKPVFSSSLPPQKTSRTPFLFFQILYSLLVFSVFLSLRLLFSLLPPDLPRRWDRVFTLAESGEALHLPAHLFQAVVASEDRRFFRHFGIDPVGISRAVLSLSSLGGGSTITQQDHKMKRTISGGHVENNLCYLDRDPKCGFLPLHSIFHHSMLFRVDDKWVLTGVHRECRRFPLPFFASVNENLVKNVFLRNERTLSRKIVEMILALILERKMSKWKILFSYLSMIYWGNGMYGIEMASEFYFGKHPSLLTLGESAMLVGIMPAPELLSPFKEPSRGKRSQARTLRRMVKAGFLDIETALLVLNQPLYLCDNGPRHVHVQEDATESRKVEKVPTFKEIWDWEKASKVWEVKEEMERWAIRIQNNKAVISVIARSD